MNLLTRALLVSPLVAGATSAHRSGFIRKSDLPDSGKEWVTLTNGVEFQPATLDVKNPQILSSIEHAKSRLLGGVSTNYDRQFVDGETYYDGYAQAWRLLGFYIDCEDVNGEQNEDGESSCTRYLMWAAYVDLKYQGGGIGEYSFYDHKSKSWDSEPCKYGTSNRCARMDCHLASTHFSLLGVFKEPSYYDWMEQLFKHLGVCVWTEEEYEFMQSSFDALPEGCTQTETTDSDGNLLYFDLKPLRKGRATFGLYTDSRCSVNYQGSTSIEDVLYEMYDNENDNDNGDNGSGDEIDAFQLQQSMNEWNEAFAIFKICQPCIAYDLGNVGYANENNDGENNDGENNDGENQDGESGDDENANFACNDDAGYTNVNQCMKFMSQTDMYTASVRDIELAKLQGTVALNGASYGKPNAVSAASICFLLSSIAVLGVGVFMLYRAMKRSKSTITEPLVPSNEGVLS